MRPSHLGLARMMSVLATVCVSVSACTIEATDLGTLPGGTFSEARDLNRGGDVVGFSETSSGAVHATLWRDGAVIDIGTLGGQNSRAYGINDLGHVVGASETSDGDWHGFFWAGDGLSDMHALAPVEVNSGSVRAINNDLWMTGNSDLAAVVWKNSVVPELLEDPWGGPMWAGDINESGEIGGYDQLNERAFRWEPGTLHYFGPDHPDELPRTQRGYGIDEFGRVAGRVYATDGSTARPKAALFSDGRETQILDAYTSSVAYDVNQLNFVVGQATEGADTVPILWISRLDWAQTLPTLGGTEGRVYRVRTTRMVGMSERADGRRHATVWRVTGLLQFFSFRAFRARVRAAGM